MEKRHFGLIGFPVGHTMSSFIHGKLFRLVGIDADYTVFPVSPEGLAQPEEKERLLGLDGFNVTIPHEQAVMTLLGKIDKEAAAFSSVSTVKDENGCLCGFTTDEEGFQKLLRAAGTSMGRKNLILGSGGVSHVMAFELVDAAYLPDLTIYVRGSGFSSARKLADTLTEHLRREQKDFLVRVYHYDELDPAESYDLAANDTPTGVHPNTHTIPPLPAELYQNISAVFDAVYNPGDTLFLQTTRRAGAVAMSGMGMPVWQAAAAQRIWYGAESDPQRVVEISRSTILEMNRMFGGVKK